MFTISRAKHILGRALYYYQNNLLLDEILNIFDSSIECFRNYPDVALIADWAGIGDTLLYGTIAHELKKKSNICLELNSYYPELFLNNPDIDIISATLRRQKILRKRLPPSNLLSPRYWTGDGSKPDKHILSILCEKAGIEHGINFKTYIYLTKREVESVPVQLRNCIAIQSYGKPSWGINKNWDPNKYQGVVDHFRKDICFIQLGNAGDPPLEGCIDMRGKTSLRYAASILFWSRCFVGQVGALMHLSRAVNLKSVIVYGGFEAPWQSGYDLNINLYSELICSPCWKMEGCTSHECMEKISSEIVIDAVNHILNTSKRPIE